MGKNEATGTPRNQSRKTREPNCIFRLYHTGLELIGYDDYAPGGSMNTRKTSKAIGGRRLARCSYKELGGCLAWNGKTIFQACRCPGCSHFPSTKEEEQEQDVLLVAALVCVYKVGAVAALVEYLVVLEGDSMVSFF